MLRQRQIRGVVCTPVMLRREVQYAGINFGNAALFQSRLAESLQNLMSLPGR